MSLFDQRIAAAGASHSRLGLPGDGNKSMAIAELGAGLAALDGSQQEALVAAALSLADGWSKAAAIARLVNGYQASRVRDCLR
jgi:hypothetical protein